MSSPTQQSVRVYLLDDELLAVKRLARLLQETNLVQIVGATTKPEIALAKIPVLQPEVLFLDIEMPGINGFEFLRRLSTVPSSSQPLIIFTTAYDQYALQAFEADSIAYLLKPIESRGLARALDKIMRFRRSVSDDANSDPGIKNLLRQMAALVEKSGHEPISEPDHVASRIGDRARIIKAATITHFTHRDKQTFAVTEAKLYPLDESLAQLEQRFARNFVRVHRTSLVNLAFVSELRGNTMSGLTVLLSDAKHTELAVARDRAQFLRERLGL